MSRVFRPCRVTVPAQSRTGQAAVFTDIGDVAREELRRMFGPAPEPTEIQLMRLQAADEAGRVVQEAYAQAEVMRAEAQREGYARGMAEGHAAGLEQARADVEQLKADLRAGVAATLAQVEAERQQMWRDAETQLIAFVLEVARKVVKEEAKVNREVAISVIRNALRRVTETESVRVRVNIEDLETVRSCRDELIALVDGVAGIEIVDDRRVGPGGCVVETGSGAIDARLDTQLDEIETALQTTVEEAA